MWTMWWTPTNASKWQTGFNSAFQGLKAVICCSELQAVCFCWAPNYIMSCHHSLWAVMASCSDIHWRHFNLRICKWRNVCARISCSCVIMWSFAVKNDSRNTSARSLFAIYSTENRLRCAGPVQMPAVLLSGCVMPAATSERQQLSQFCSLHNVAVDILVTRYPCLTG